MKYSKLHIPNKGKVTRRWQWSKPLGWKDKGKEFDFLLLVGEKDVRFFEQYPDDSPFVYFLIPKSRVPDILTIGRTIGSQAQIITNLARAACPTSQAIKEHIVSETEIKAISKYGEVAVSTEHSDS